ncbi:hypothetical protein [Campylobacter sp. MIT 97-5078]|uniref:hypothetical protein n=1 Tax=Campylobacter sp. MIT 97-5078 TaxID=1548153 RepID=UPI000AD45CD8|nr:hypothetical protein [Campylobacter sp. MIT 97-5078]
MNLILTHQSLYYLARENFSQINFYDFEGSANHFIFNRHKRAILNFKGIFCILL